MNTNLFTPTTVQHFKPQGILVTVNGLPVVAYPSTTITTKNGRKRFYFWYRHSSVLAVWNGNGYAARF